MIKKALKYTLSILFVVLGANACAEPMNVRMDGHLGVRRGDGNSLTIYLNTCSYSVQQIDIMAGREGLSVSQPNPVVGTLSRTDPVKGDLTVNTSSSDNWATDPPLVMPADQKKVMVVFPRVAGKKRPKIFEQKSFPTLAFTQEDLDRLSSNEILVFKDFESGEVRTETLQQFHQFQCR